MTPIINKFSNISRLASCIASSYTTMYTYSKLQRQEDEAPPSSRHFLATLFDDDSTCKPSSNDNQRLLETLFDDDCDDEASKQSRRKRKFQNKNVPFEELSSSYQSQVRRKICNSFFDIFDKHNITRPDDMRGCVKLLNEDIGASSNEVPLAEAIFMQQSNMTLAQRDDFCRLLTHDVESEPVEHILQHLPRAIRNRSRQLSKNDKSGGRKSRRDKIDLDIIEEYMHDYCRMNTFANNVKVGYDSDGKPIFHRPHEYTDILENIYKLDFLHSTENKMYQLENSGKNIGFSKFKEGATRCPCIRKPTLRACVDELEVNIAESLNALRMLKRSKRGSACSCQFCKTFAAGKKFKGKEFVSPFASPLAALRHLIQCPKIKFPCMDNLVDETIFRKDCCYEDCEKCACFSRSDECFLNCPTLFDDGQTISYIEFETHTLDNGHSIRELREQKSRPMAEFKEKFLVKLEKYKSHYFKYKWLEHCRKFDMASLADCDLYIQTDYSAQPVLDSQDKLNSQGHGVCVLSCWVVLHSPQDIEYVDDQGRKQKFRYYECDHVRVVSPSKGKGKDQDWFLHCTIFDHLIEHYKKRLPNMKKVVVWTDGAPTQYKCRQNFFYVAQSFRKHGIVIVHRFGATAQFKGVHDKVGQVAKIAVGYDM